MHESSRGINLLVHRDIAVRRRRIGVGIVNGRRSGDVGALKEPPRAVGPRLRTWWLRKQLLSLALGFSEIKI